MWARAVSEFGAIVILTYNPKVVSVLSYDRFTGEGLDAALPVVRNRDDHTVRLQATLQHVGRRLIVFNYDHAGRRRVRADGFLYRFHFFFVFFVPSVSPRSQRIATMNFEGRSSRVFSFR